MRRRSLLIGLLGVLATSRESLGLPGEVEVRVPALPLPDDGHVSDNDAMRLFLDRARAVRPDLEPTPGDRDAIARICRRVPRLAPRTFHEALQMYWFMHLGTIMELNVLGALTAIVAAVLLVGAAESLSGRGKG